MDYTQVKGTTNELQCILKFMELGFHCSIPYGNSAKYDFIADDGINLYKIQCKSANCVKSPSSDDIDKVVGFCISTTSQTTNTKETIRHKYSIDQIDYFATCFENNVYVIPVDECSTNKTLRFFPPKNGQKNYTNAEDYLITNVFDETDDLIYSREKYLESRELIKSPLKEYFCQNCGKPVTKEGNLCPECAALASRKVENRPDRDLLKYLIRNESFRQIGIKYNVSDNAIRRWCISYNLPSKKKDIVKYNNEEWELA